MLTVDTSRLEARIARILRTYGEEMSCKDLAREEGCSTRTARRRMSNFDYGALTKRSARDVKIETHNYVKYLRERTVVTKLCA